MRMRNWAAPIAVVLSICAGSALSATLSNLSGQSCGDGTGTWHFVNNQTGGAADGTLTANFTSGQCVVSSSKNTGSTQHFYCTGFSGTLTGASTTLPGRLVLSDFSCTTPPPPKCDPTTEKCDPPPKG
jgi:hypothetical protein